MIAEGRTTRARKRLGQVAPADLMRRAARRLVDDGLSNRRSREVQQ